MDDSKRGQKPIHPFHTPRMEGAYGSAEFSSLTFSSLFLSHIYIRSGGEEEEREEQQLGFLHTYSYFLSFWKQQHKCINLSQSIQDFILSGLYHELSLLFYHLYLFP